ncbi:MAG: amidohydrolase family protein [Gemmatimonadetes bacterium]|nr:amidohydrolase family protein [Gemmatimonadota bacterium]
MNVRLCVIAATLGFCSSLSAQTTSTVVIRGGQLFDGVLGHTVPNSGLVVRAGRFFEVGADVDGSDLGDAQVIELSDDDYILPGFFDLHAHYAVDLFGRGRVDERKAYPVLFLANGVTSTFPAGEMNPVEMRDLRMRIDRGAAIGPRIFNSGPYFGTARPGWNREMTAEEIHEDVDYWVAQGTRGFKAKGIRPYQLRALIERAHMYGRTVTGHLDSGFRNSVNPRDAIAMGIDRVEHFLGGDAMPSDRSAYASLVEMDPNTAAFDSIVAMYIRHGVFFDATLSAYGYYGERDPKVYAYFTDEMQYLTPYVRGIIESRPPRQVSEQFETIYWVKRRTLKAFYDAGGGHLITLGTDHPSWGEFFSGFSVQRELHSFVLAGIPAADALKFATMNAALALGVGSQLGSIEVGKLADLVVVTGNPLEDIRNTRNTILVMKGGTVYDPAEILQSVVGTIGPRNADEELDWMPRGRGG